jgi:hypothetical protein
MSRLNRSALLALVLLIAISLWLLARQGGFQAAAEPDFGPDERVLEHTLPQSDDAALLVVPALEAAGARSSEGTLEESGRIAWTPAQTLAACLTELERAFDANYTPRAFDAQLSSIVARHGLRQNAAVQAELCARLEAPATDAAGVVRLLALARGAQLCGARGALALLSSRQRAWNAALGALDRGPQRQEALRGLAALGGVKEVTRLYQLLVESDESEEAPLRTAMAAVRDASALAQCLERSLQLDDERKALLLWGAAEEAVERERGQGDAARMRAMHARLRGALSRTMEQRQRVPALAQRALAISSMLDPERAREQARHWLGEAGLAPVLRQSAQDALKNGAGALEQLERVLPDPSLGSEARLLAIEGALHENLSPAMRALAQAFLRDLAQQSGAQGRRALHALATLRDPADLELLRSIAREGTDPLARAAARNALSRAESEWKREDL